MAQVLKPASGMKPVMPQQQPKGKAGPYPCRNIDLVAHLTLDDLGYNPDRFGVMWDQKPGANDIWGWTDPQTNDEYAIIGLTGATAFVRISRPETPEVVGILYNSEVVEQENKPIWYQRLVPKNSRAILPSPWRDMKVVNDHVYIVSEAIGMGIQVFDLRTLRGLDATKPVRELNVTAWLTKLPNGEEIDQAHDVVHNPATQRIFLVGGTVDRYKSCGGGIKIFDVSDPAKPAFLGCYADDGYTHDAQCVLYSGPDTRFTNREICFAYNEDTLTIVDTTDPSNIQLISRTKYDVADYTHQGWITEDMSVLLLDDEKDESSFRDINNEYSGETMTHIFDITDLKNPVIKNTYFSTETSIDHNQYILGNFVYQSNYQAGLRVLHINQEKFDLTEVAYFDVFPDDTKVHFDGMWSNYPYFTKDARGIVAASSIEFGLYLLRPNMEQIQRDLETKKKVGLQRRTRRILSSDEGLGCPGLEEIRQC